MLAAAAGQTTGHSCKPTPRCVCVRMPGLICEGDCKKAKNQKTKQGEVCETRIKEKRMDGWMDGGESALRIERETVI